jgi:hypothetical protein
MMNVAELKKGYEAFQAREARDSMYKTATFLVNTFWGQPKEMADGLGVLLLTWNNAFYRYGFFDFDVLEKCIGENQQILENYRHRNILDYTSADDESINDLYSKFLNALQIADGKSAGRKSPVAVAKALHLLAPGFFALWDDKIARAYNCHYDYIPFMQEMKSLAQILAPEINIDSTGKTLLKLIDEYNYAKFTKQWV